MPADKIRDADASKYVARRNGLIALGTMIVAIIIADKTADWWNAPWTVFFMAWFILFSSISKAASDMLIKKHAELDAAQKELALRKK